MDINQIRKQQREEAMERSKNPAFAKRDLQDRGVYPKEPVATEIKVESKIPPVKK